MEIIFFVRELQILAYLVCKFFGFVLLFSTVKLNIWSVGRQVLWSRLNALDQNVMGNSDVSEEFKCKELFFCYQIMFGIRLIKPTPHSIYEYTSKDSCGDLP